MKLVVFNKNKEYEESFKKYILELKNEITDSRDDYFSMYKSLLENYDDSMNHFINLSSIERSEKKEPYVRFYWFMDDNKRIIGTIRYRTNIPGKHAELLGNIGYELSPIFRGQGIGTKMLHQLIVNLKNENVEKVLITVSKTNLPSIRVVVSNDGRFIGDIFSSESNEYLNKYEICISNSL